MGVPICPIPPASWVASPSGPPAAPSVVGAASFRFPLLSGLGCAPLSWVREKAPWREPGWHVSMVFGQRCAVGVAHGHYEPPALRDLSLSLLSPSSLPLSPCPSVSSPVYGKRGACLGRFLGLVSTMGQAALAGAVHALSLGRAVTCILSQPPPRCGSGLCWCRVMCAPGGSCALTTVSGSLPLSATAIETG